MNFRVFSVVDHYPKELPRTSAEFYGELLEQVEAADVLGFESFSVAKQVLRSLELLSRHVLPHFTPSRAGG